MLSLAGLLASSAAIAFALNAEFAAAGACICAAFVADVYDGPVAKRLKGRSDSDRAFGANLDSLIDMAGAGIVPGIILLSYGGFGALYAPGAFLILAAAALRLSYFNVHGLGGSATHYTGLPTDLVILAFSSLLLLDTVLAEDAFRALLYGSTVLLSALMVSSLQVPKLEGKWYYGLPLLAGIIALAHISRIIA